MKTMRQDAWTAEDDARLAEIVLRHIRDGSTQLSAFQEGAQALNRTPAACGYRWNACVRKQFLAAIDQARTDRKENREQQYKQELENEIQEGKDAAAVTWSAVFRFLRQTRQDLHNLRGRIRQLEKDVEKSRSETEELRRERSEMAQELQQLSLEHVVVSDDYKALLDIVERARRRQPAEE